MPGVLHWGPLIAITIVTVISITSTYSALQLWSLPRSVVKYFRGTHFVLMYIWLIPIFYNFFTAVYTHKYVPLKWKPKNKADEKYLQWCSVCQGFKAPRSHHCKQCNRCVTKMDHHCPWINSCVDHGNQPAFIRFLFFVPFGCLHGTIVNSNFIYRLVNYSFFYYNSTYPITTFWVIFTIAGISLGVGTTIGVTILLIVQVKSVLTNRTQIEDWIVEKARHRRKHDDSIKPFIFPYNLGFPRNFRQVINWSGRCQGDGLKWEVAEGCFEFSLTVEQLEQKQLKKKQAVTCEVKRDYSGSGCPLNFGLLTCLCTPRCDEGKVKVQSGDIVTVTRWGNRWVYGDRRLPQAMTEKGLSERGWFPRACVLPLEQQTNNNNESESDSTNTESENESTEKKRLQKKATEKPKSSKVDEKPSKSLASAGDSSKSKRSKVRGKQGSEKKATLTLQT